MIQAAIAWCIALSAYAAIHILPRALIADTALRSGLTAGLCAAYWLALLAYLYRRGRAADWGLRPPRRDLSPALLVPFAIPIAQIALYGMPVAEPSGIVLCASAVLGEELIFRGALLRLLRGLGIKPRTCAMMSGLLFGAAHTTNLLSGSAYVPVQIAYACCAGFGLCAVADAAGCLWIGCAVHFLINLTATSGACGYWPEAIFALLFAALGWWIYTKEEKG